MTRSRGPAPSGGLPAAGLFPEETVEAYLGIDLGFSSCKAVALSAGREILATAVGTAAPGGAERLLAELRDELGAGGGAAPVVSTGAGRWEARFAEQAVSDVICHARAGFWRVPHGRVIVDLGGRASRLLVLGARGELLDFATDDGWTGGMRRLLELLAAALAMEVSDLGALVPVAADRVELDDGSLPRAEHQVVTLLEQGRRPEDLVAAVERSIARRVRHLLARLVRGSPRGAVVLTGGFARNGGIVRAIEEELGTPAVAMPEAPLAGAIGAALVGWGEPGPCPEPG